jgi:hypothetical protein
VTELLIDAPTLAQRLGIPIEKQTTDVLATIEGAIYDSQAKVMGELNRDSLTGRPETVQGLTADASYPLTDARAWPQAAEYFDDELAVVESRVSTLDEGLFDVDFIVGLNVSGQPHHPITRFVARDAEEQLGANARFCARTGIERIINSVSAGGQSVSYDKASARKNGDTGGVVGLESLRRFRRFALYQRPMRPFNPWPYV